MGQKKKGMLSCLILVFFFTILLYAPRTVSAEVVSDGDGIVIYLDAGHDSTHAGARANGLKEELLNLKIAKYCKEKLEEYEGVTVYLCRSGAKCPYPGTDSIHDNVSRVKDAAEKNATLYVAIHNNYAKSTRVNGAAVYYPNSNYNEAVADEGMGVAQAVLDQLTALGLKDRGILIRMTEDNSRYPDNSKADYYNTIKTSKMCGFPGIIIEHAYMSSSSDVSHYLNSDAKLKKLGVADAKGIAAYYGLHKKKTTRVNLKKVAQVTEDEITVTWSKMEGADYYLVLRRELLTSEEEDAEEEESDEELYSAWETVKKTKKTKFTDTDFEEDTTYYYTVKAHMEETDTFSKKNPTGFSVTTK
jgi:N-acetylmuramoyl-L-alanine amidase